jgi:N-acetylglucosaminyldiphosphoundecaprenol N-acetyl-beta-D-mannosaminyltransferase
MPELRIFDLVFKGLTSKCVFQPKDGCKLIITVNADFIIRVHDGDIRLANIINGNTSTFDGQWPYLVARLRSKNVPIEKLSGSDLIFNLSTYCIEHNSKLVIFGGTPDSSERASIFLNKKYGTNFCFSYSPDFELYPYSLNFINNFKSFIMNIKPEVVVNCLGTPSQEYFSEDMLSFLSANGVKYCMGAGGTVDFLAGKFRRAPVWIQIIGLEWLWRFFMQPSLFRAKRILYSMRFFKLAHR